MFHSIVSFMKLYIKNMVCIRCIIIVRAELSRLGLSYTSVELGEAEIIENISAEQQKQLRAALLKWGLELMENKRSVLVQKIKILIIELVHYRAEPFPLKLSAFLSQKLTHNYTYLANIFSEDQGISIEHFYIGHKIERVKELLIYDELSINEIAFKLNYSSVAHLCTQFKNVTGLTTSAFKRLKTNKRYMLESIGEDKRPGKAAV